MSYPTIDAAILKRWRDWALTKKNANAMKRKADILLSGEGPPTPILSLPGSRKVCLKGEFFPGQFVGFAVVDGKVYGWGLNNHNLFGLSALSSSDVAYLTSPTRLGAGLAPIKAVASSSFGNLLLMEDGTLRSGNGTLAAFSIDEENWSAVTGISGVAAISAGQWTSTGQQYILMNDGTVWARGRRVPGISSEFSNTSDWSTDLTEFQQMPTARTGTGIVEIAGGFAELAFRRADGAIFRWANQDVMPTAMPTPPTGAIKMAYGNGWHLLTASGDIYSLSSDATSWQQASGSNYVDVATGGNYSAYAIKSDGTMWWSSNFDAPLNFVQKGTDADWSAVYGSAFATNPVATKTDGCAYTWGFNTFGSAGQGTTYGDEYLVPVPLKVSAAYPAWV